MNQVMGRDIKAEQHKLDAFERQFKKENPSHALHIAESLLSSVEREAKTLAQSFEPYKRAMTHNQLTSAQKEELGQLMKHIVPDSSLMRTFKKDYPELSQQVERFLKMNQQQLRIRTIDKELDL